jgi:hypothetical protein
VHAGAIGVESQEQLAGIISDPTKHNVARCEDKLSVTTFDLHDPSTINKHKDLMVMIFQKRPKGAQVPKARNRTFMGSIALTESGVPSQYTPWPLHCLSALPQEQHYVIYTLGTWLQDDQPSKPSVKTARKDSKASRKNVISGMLAMYAEQVFQVSVCIHVCLILPYSFSRRRGRTPTTFCSSVWRM